MAARLHDEFAQIVDESTTNDIIVNGANITWSYFDTEYVMPHPSIETAATTATVIAQCGNTYIHASRADNASLEDLDNCAVQIFIEEPVRRFGKQAITPFQYGVELFSTNIITKLSHEEMVNSKHGKGMRVATVKMLFTHVPYIVCTVVGELLLKRVRNRLICVSEIYKVGFDDLKRAVDIASNDLRCTFGRGFTERACHAIEETKRENAEEKEHEDFISSGRPAKKLKMSYSDAFMHT